MGSDCGEDDLLDYSLTLSAKDCEVVYTCECWSRLNGSRRGRRPHSHSHSHSQDKRSSSGYYSSGAAPASMAADNTTANDTDTCGESSEFASTSPCK